MRNFCLIAGAVLIFLISCHDDNSPKKNILLLEKSLDKIKYDLRGVWQLHYTWGGYIVRTFHYDGIFINFHEGNSIAVIDTAKIWADNVPLIWAKDLNKIKNRFGGNDSIFYMTHSFADQDTFHWLPIRIKDDTLEIWDIKMADGLAYLLTHTK
jgi:hypothetical protein